MDTEQTAEIERARLRVADTIGGLIEFWGFKRPMGRIWTLLYLTPEPLTAAQIGERLSMSAGGVSMAISELAKWGVVRRKWMPGDRRDFFEAETKVWKMISRVVRERELPLVHEAAETFASAEQVLARAIRSRSKEEQRRLEFARSRIGLLRALAKLGEVLLSSFIAGSRVDTKALREFKDADTL